MNKVRTILVTLLFVSAHDASAQKEPALEFKKIFKIISSKDALSTSFREHLKRMSPLCTKRDENEPDYAKKGNVKCIGKTDIPQLDMSGTSDPAVSIVDATIAGAEKCAYMRSALVQQYGKPAEGNGNCDSKWHIKRGKSKPLVHIVLEENSKKDVVYFGNEEEQGQ